MGGMTFDGALIPGQADARSVVDGAPTEAEARRPAFHGSLPVLALVLIGSTPLTVAARLFAVGLASGTVAALLLMFIAYRMGRADGYEAARKGDRR